MSATELTPEALAELVRPTLGRGLVAFDVDGVLAPIVEHADDSELTEGAHDALSDLARRVPVAIVSGRALASLERLFRFPTEIHVIGSHGLELRGAEPMQLDREEQRRFDRLELLGKRAVDDAGDGAWLEYKPASVVLHTRTADDGRAERAVAALTEQALAVDGAEIKNGHEVVELLARTASKGRALADLLARLGRSPLVYFGDDLTDEEVFRTMGGGDVSIRVGGGETAARYRLAGPDAVSAFLDQI